MKTTPVPYGFRVSVSIERVSAQEGERAFVNIHAPMYVRKEHRAPNSYIGLDFTDGQILRDDSLHRYLLAVYGPAWSDL